MAPSQEEASEFSCLNLIIQTPSLTPVGTEVSLCSRGHRVDSECPGAGSLMGSCRAESLIDSGMLRGFLALRSNRNEPQRTAGCSQQREQSEQKIQRQDTSYWVQGTRRGPSGTTWVARSDDELGLRKLDTPEGQGRGEGRGWIACPRALSSSVVPFFSCPQSFPASGSFQMSQFLTSSGQSIGVSASTSVLPMNTQD